MSTNSCFLVFRINLQGSVFCATSRLLGQTAFFRQSHGHQSEWLEEKKRYHPLEPKVKGVYADDPPGRQGRPLQLCGLAVLCAGRSRRATDGIRDLPGPSHARYVEADSPLPRRTSPRPATGVAGACSASSSAWPRRWMPWSPRTGGPSGGLASSSPWGSRRKEGCVKGAGSRSRSRSGASPPTRHGTASTLPSKAQDCGAS